jgi:hypothetical protein
VSTRLENTAKDFITQRVWLHSRRIEVNEVVD